ncbi:O-antigen polymerase [Leptospira adleri]|uniref:O-antigen polymerase n=1 Tax=Leptospira adleri TaxID=2023186 RepID=UPI001083A6AB|nr:O-antigen polymerase [Leptospira adleri]TGM56528.1 oligosaccharide repeat unit polymerase [Leptospira adleri]
MSLLIIIFALVNIGISYFLFRKKGLVLIFIQSYWFFWMFVSSLSLTGLFVPSNRTYFLFIGMLSSITLGAALFYFISRRKTNISREFNSFFKLTDLEKGGYFFVFILLTVFPIVLFFFVRSIWLQQLPGAPYPALFRDLAFGLNGESILFWKSKYLYYYSLSVSPLILASLFLGTAYYLKHNQRRILILAIFLVIMDTLMMLGRFGFYYILLMGFLILAVKCLHDWRNIIGSFSIGKFAGGILILFALVFLVGSLRSIERKFDVREFIDVYIIDYHTESFVMFDVELNDKNSLIHKTTYGRASLGGIERGFSFALALFRVPFYFQVQSDLIGGYLHKNRLLGYTQDGKPKHYNAFGSVLFSLYKDGGIFFIVLMGAVFGFSISKLSFSLLSLNVYSFSLLTSLLFIGVFGLFQPVLGGPILLTFLFLLVFSFL